MAKIIGISGKKQSGKNTAANYINGTILKSKSMVEDFYIDDEGGLAIKTTDQSGKSGYGILDVTRKDAEFVEYAEKEMWPFIKVYHFADALKEISSALFGLNLQQLYGTDKQKNMKTNLLWEDMPTPDGKTGKMTNREFLEYFGTKIVRKIRSDAWVKATINKIVAENSEIAIIPDVRFPNEVEAIKDNGGVVIRLQRDVFKSTIECETALDEGNFDWSVFDHVVDNRDISMTDFCSKLESINTVWSI
jgi:hypothetical protein